MKKTKLLALGLAVGMIFGTTACGGAKTATDTTVASSASSSVAVETVVEKTPVTLSVMVDAATDWNNYPDNPVAKEIAKKTGVTIEMVVVDKEKAKVLIAGGDLSDIIMAKNDADNQQYRQLIEGKNVIPLDDLLKTNGKDIESSVPKMLEFSRANWSNGENKVYYLTTGIGAERAGVEPGIGPMVRWDYYKELGYPEIKNTDDLLNMLKTMQEKHPKTDDGKKVYGVGAWNDWGSWYSSMVVGPFLGWNGYTKLGQTEYNPILTMADGPIWSGIKFMYKANQMGILDPDALIMGYEDLHTKATNGQTLFSPVNWIFDNFNGANNKDAKGYMALPLDWASQWYGTDFYAGFSNKGYAITKNCKTPDRAMDLLNYLWSYEGARTVFSGVKGEQWDLVDGKPVMKDEFTKLRVENGDAWKALQIGNMGLNFMTAFNTYYINPADNAPMSLFDSEDLYNTNLNPLQKDFSDHYAVKYPAQAFLNLVEAGKVLNQGSSNPYISEYMAPQPDDIKTIAAKVDAEIIKAAAKCILSKNDAEFDSNMAKAIDDINALGYDKFNTWYTAEWNKAKATVGIK